MEPSVTSSGGGDSQQVPSGVAVAQVAPLVSTTAAGGLREEQVQMTPPHSPPPSIPTSPGAASSASSPRSATERVMGVVGIARTSYSDMDASGSSTSGSPHKFPLSEDVFMAGAPRTDVTHTVVTTETTYTATSKDANPSIPSPGGRKSFSDEVRKVVYQRPHIPPKHSAVAHAVKSCAMPPSKPSRAFSIPKKTSPISSTSYESDC